MRGLLPVRFAQSSEAMELSLDRTLGIPRTDSVARTLGGSLPADIADSTTDLPPHMHVYATISGFNKLRFNIRVGLRSYMRWSGTPVILVF